MYFQGRKVKETKKAVVKRDDSLVTKEELLQHGPEVEAAIQKGFETWVKHECISREPRAGVKNIINVRWVYKWKHEAEVRSAESSDTSSSTTRRVIRARVCLRGFKNVRAQGIANSVGTSQRYSQRLVCSEAVLRQ